MIAVVVCALVCAQAAVPHTSRWARLDAARKETLGRQLWEASAAGGVAEVRALLEQGVDPDHYRSAPRWTALMQASIRSDHAARDSIAAALIEHGADVNAVDADGWGSLHSLAMLGGDGALAMARLLVDRGADIHRRDAGGFSPLDLAAQKGDAAFVGFANAPKRLPG